MLQSDTSTRRDSNRPIRPPDKAMLPSRHPAPSRRYHHRPVALGMDAYRSPPSLHTLSSPSPRHHTSNLYLSSLPHSPLRLSLLHLPLPSTPTVKGARTGAILYLRIREFSMGLEAQVLLWFIAAALLREAPCAPAGGSSAEGAGMTPNGTSRLVVGIVGISVTAFGIWIWMHGAIPVRAAIR